MRAETFKARIARVYFFGFALGALTGFLVGLAVGWSL